MISDSDNHVKLVARGVKYLELSSAPSYIQVTGNIIKRSYWANYSQNSTGRAVIDVRGMRAADENYSMYYGKDEHGRSDDSDQPETTLDIPGLSDLIKMTCIPFLYGFSFKSKIWGEFAIDQISDIKFREDAYDKLVLDEDTKQMVFALVEDSGYVQEMDIVDGKGGGCIFLAEGNPGTGKTATAEAIAEKLQRPLHSVSVGELGTNVAQLEDNLKRILEVASTWNAILLIDEADIFLEARNDLDIERNAMVAVFLHLLEYFPGIMFLTTNRATNLDQAFFSRITLAIHYPDLPESSRVSICENLLGNADMDHIDAALIACHDLNGRQIKHVIKAAGALARFGKRTVKQEDFDTIIRKQNEFKIHLAKLAKAEEAI